MLKNDNIVQYKLNLVKTSTKILSCTFAEVKLPTLLAESPKLMLFNHTFTAKTLKTSKGKQQKA
ncbi:MAG TPA: hypothetical protein VK203_19475 [Nostocaceae cyanobacterium]|nr:hypothetical protein [Nostocaceae cyanobacterium]